MIVVDTKVLSALADRRDERHAGCTGWFRGNDEVRLVPPTVLAEACYLIDRDRGEAAFLDSAGISGNNASGWPDWPTQTCAAWLSSCDATPAGHPGGTGASVIAVHERLAIVTVATVNLRDLAHVRPRHMAALA